MAHSASKVVAGRVTKGTARALYEYCSTHNCTQSSALRKALTLLSSSADDPEATLTALRELLGIDATATEEEVKAAIAELFQQAGEAVDPGADGLQDSADPPSPISALSAEQRATADRIVDPKKKASFIEMCAKLRLRASGKPLAPKPRTPQAPAAPQRQLSAEQQAAADRITDPTKKARFIEMCAKSRL